MRLRRRKEEKTKFELPTEPVMTLPDFNIPFGMRTDASQYAIGGVLFQWDKKGNEHPIWYASRVLKGPEKIERVRKRKVSGVRIDAVLETVPMGENLQSLHRP